MHFLCVGDEVAFLAADWAHDPDSDGLVMYGAALANAGTFVPLGNHGFWKVVDALNSGDVANIDEAILVSREVRKHDKVSRSVLRDSVRLALEEADHACLTP